MASAALRSASAGTWSNACAAYQYRPRAGSTSTAIVRRAGASVPGSSPIVTPNCCRVFAYSTDRSTSCAAPPKASAASSTSPASRTRAAAAAPPASARTACSRAGARAIRRVRSIPRVGSTASPRAPRSTSASPPPRVPTTNRSACAPNGTCDLHAVERRAAGAALHSSGCQRPSPSANAIVPSASPRRELRQPGLLLRVAARRTGSRAPRASGRGTDRARPRRRAPRRRAPGRAARVPRRRTRRAPRSRPSPSSTQALPQRGVVAVLAVEDRAHAAWAGTRSPRTAAPSPAAAPARRTGRSSRR